MTPLPSSLSERLRPHQHQPAQELLEILRRFGSGVDLSATGTGKTYVAAAVAKMVNQPTLVIAPKIALTQWQRAAEHFGDSFSVIGYEMLRSGGTPFGRWQHGNPPPREERLFFKCQCCQQINPSGPCYAHHLGIHCLETKVKSHHYGRFIFHPSVKLIIFDEIHRCGLDSLNSDMLIASKPLKVLGLSATAACSPLNMRALGFLLDLHRLTNFEYWARKVGCSRLPGVPGLRWTASKTDQQKFMLAIRDQIIPSRGVRISTEEIAGFPDCQIQAELYDLPAKDSAALNALYLEVAESLNLLEEKKKSDQSPEHPLTKRLRARQQIELLKIPIAAELGEDFREQDCSVVWFVNFRQTVCELQKRFPEALVIDGLDTNSRQNSIDLFQSNHCRELIVNNAAGGVALSLHDLQGDFPRVGLVMPCDSAVTMRQLFGRLARDGGKSAAYYKVLFAAKTVETQMHRALTQKLNNLDALLDGDLQPQNLQFA